MNISELSDSTGQPNFSGIQTLITPTSQYVFPPSLASSLASTSQQATTTTTNTTTTSFQLQEGQIQKYPPFIGQAVTSLQSQPGVHMVNTSCRLAMISSVSTPVVSTPYVITGTTDTARKGKQIIPKGSDVQYCVQIH